MVKIGIEQNCKTPFQSLDIYLVYSAKIRKTRAGGSSKILVWHSIVNLSNIGVAHNSKS